MRDWRLLELSGHKRRSRFTSYIIVQGVVIAAAMPLAAHADSSGSSAVEQLLECRALPDREARLACYDTHAGALDVAMKSGDLLVTDREQRAAVAKADFGQIGAATAATATQRQLAKAQRRPEPLDRVEAVITGAGQLPGGRWSVVLEGGARWQQMDDRILSRDPRPGMRITIRRAALGSYLGNIDGQTAIRLRRVD